jgi:hypothetical protein
MLPPVKRQGTRVGCCEWVSGRHTPPTAAVPAAHLQIPSPRQSRTRHQTLCAHQAQQAAADAVARAAMHRCAVGAFTAAAAAAAPSAHQSPPQAPQRACRPLQCCLLLQALLRAGAGVCGGACATARVGVRVRAGCVGCGVWQVLWVWCRHRRSRGTAAGVTLQPALQRVSLFGQRSRTHALSEGVWLARLHIQQHHPHPTTDTPATTPHAHTRTHSSRGRPALRARPLLSPPPRLPLQPHGCEALCHTLPGAGLVDTSAPLISSRG